MEHARNTRRTFASSHNAGNTQFARCRSIGKVSLLPTLVIYGSLSLSLSVRMFVCVCVCVCVRACVLLCFPLNVSFVSVTGLCINIRLILHSYLTVDKVTI